MKYLILLISTLLIVNTAFANLQQELHHFHSMYAHFNQTAVAPGGQKLQGSGEVWLVKPNQFRWQVVKPNKQLYVTDGKTLWTYEPDLMQATQRPLPKQVSQTPILLLSGQVAALDKLFVVKSLSANHYLLIPKKTGSMIRAIELNFTHGKPASLVIRNQTGQVTTIHFFDVQLNVPIAISQFHFSPPTGVSVLK